MAGAPFQHEVVGRNRTRSAQLFQRIKTRLAIQATIAGVETLHALGASGALRARARAIPAELTIVHNEIPHWIGCDLLAVGRRVATDFEDWHTEDLLPADRRSRPLALMRRVEQCLLQRSAYVSTTSHALSTALVERYGGRTPIVLTNSFSLQPDPRSAAVADEPTFFWFSQTIGPGRGLEPFFTAWRGTTAPSRVALLGQVRRGFDQHLLSLLPEKFRARVTFLPLVSPVDLPRVIARHDIGLALEHATIRNRDLTITNKILQYMNAGLAIVASETAGQREVMASAPGAGVIVDLGDSAGLARQLDDLLANRAQIAAMGRAARQSAEATYCWEREAPKLLAQVAASLPANLPS